MGMGKGRSLVRPRIRAIPKPLHRTGALHTRFTQAGDGIHPLPAPRQAALPLGKPAGARGDLFVSETPKGGISLW
jgi:hypothetical protein